MRLYGFNSSVKLLNSEPLNGKTLMWFLKAAKPKNGLDN